MLERIAPHLAMIGIHKNGTWAAQKIIECVQTPEEVTLVTQNLRPYVPPLLLDQFGNYVVQCVNFCSGTRFVWLTLTCPDAAYVSELPPPTFCSMLWSIGFGKSLKGVSGLAV